MMIGIFLSGMFRMFVGMGGMTMRLVRVMTCLRVFTLFMEFGGMFVVLRCATMVFSGSLVVFN